MEKSFPLGIYQHYKSDQLYEVIGVARHSETHEEMVIYKALYDCPTSGENQIWLRSKAMFCEQVSHHGQILPRFKLINE